MVEHEALRVLALQGHGVGDPLDLVVGDGVSIGVDEGYLVGRPVPPLCRQHKVGHHGHPPAGGQLQPFRSRPVVEDQVRRWFVHVDRELPAVVAGLLGPLLLPNEECHGAELPLPEDRGQGPVPVHEDAVFGTEDGRSVEGPSEEPLVGLPVGHDGRVDVGGDVVRVLRGGDNLPVRPEVGQRAERRRLPDADRGVGGERLDHVAGGVAPVPHGPSREPVPDKVRQFRVGASEGEQDLCLKLRRVREGRDAGVVQGKDGVAEHRDEGHIAAGRDQRVPVDLRVLPLEALDLPVVELQVPERRLGQLEGGRARLQLHHGLIQPQSVGVPHHGFGLVQVVVRALHGHEREVAVVGFARDRQVHGVPVLVRDPEELRVVQVEGQCAVQAVRRLVEVGRAVEVEPVDADDRRLLLRADDLDGECRAGEGVGMDARDLPQVQALEPASGEHAAADAGHRGVVEAEPLEVGAVPEGVVADGCQLLPEEARLQSGAHERLLADRLGADGVHVGQVGRPLERAVADVLHRVREVHVPDGRASVEGVVHQGVAPVPDDVDVSVPVERGVGVFLLRQHDVVVDAADPYGVPLLQRCAVGVRLLWVGDQRQRHRQHHHGQGRGHYRFVHLITRCDRSNGLRMVIQRLRISPRCCSIARLNLRVDEGIASSIGPRMSVDSRNSTYAYVRLCIPN